MTKLLLVVACLAGCARDTSCAAVMKHLEKITPAEARSAAFAGRRGPMMERCAKDLTEADRKCILDADDLYEALECKPM